VDKTPIERLKIIELLKLRPLTIDNVFMRVELDNEVPIFIGPKNFLDEGATNNANLMITKTCKFVKFVQVSSCWTTEESIKGSDHIGTSLRAHFKNLLSILSLRFDHVTLDTGLINRRRTIWYDGSTAVNPVFAISIHPIVNLLDFKKEVWIGGVLGRVDIGQVGILTVTNDKRYLCGLAGVERLALDLRSL
jgi:hypothetical protein